VVIGVGVDIVKVVRVKKIVEEWGDVFLNRIFSKEELDSFYRGKIYYQQIAGRFAAKEAIMKAIPQRYGIWFKDIIILHHPDGAPYCKFTKDVGIKIFISITHIEEYAIACVVAQKGS